MTSNEIITETVEPSQCKLDFYYYAKSGHIVRELILTIGEKKLRMNKNRITQMFGLLNVPYMDTLNKDWDNRNEILNKALSEKTEPFKIDYINDFVVRVTSTEFTAIPHTVILKAVYRAMQSRNLDFHEKVRYEDGLYAEWNIGQLKDVGDMAFNIWARNKNDAMHSLRIGAGMVILACQNGAIDKSGAGELKVIHRGEYNDLYDRIEDMVRKQLDRFYIYPTRIAKAKEIEVPFKIGHEFIWKTKYPKHIKAQLTKRWREEPDTLFGLFQDWTWVGSHYDTTFNYEMALKSEATTFIMEPDKTLENIGITTQVCQEALQV